jgi:hypothetical protein
MIDYIVLESMCMSEMRDHVDTWSEQGYTLMGPVTVIADIDYPPYMYLATMEKADEAED